MRVKFLTLALAFATLASAQEVTITSHRQILKGTESSAYNPVLSADGQQLLFSGVIFELEGIGKRIADITISKWSIGAYGTIANLNSLDLKMQEEFPMIEHETEALYKFAESNLMEKWAVLAVMLLVCLIVSGVILRRVAKDKR